MIKVDRPVRASQNGSRDDCKQLTISQSELMMHHRLRCKLMRCLFLQLWERAPNVLRYVLLTCYMIYINFIVSIMAYRIMKCIQITHPIGCPSETAPPWTFTLAGSMSSNFWFATTTTLNASLISHRAISFLLTPAFWSS